jgi:hypothetical protein
MKLREHSGSSVIRLTHEHVYEYRIHLLSIVTSILIPILHECVGGGLRDEKSSPEWGGSVRAAACTCAEGESAVAF